LDASRDDSCDHFILTAMSLIKQGKSLKFYKHENLCIVQLCSKRWKKD